MKTDLIRKEDAIKAIFDWMDTHKREVIHKQDITDVIMPLSEGIIRCKDCKCYIDHRCYENHNFVGDWRKDTDYCSHAERIE